MNQGAPKQTTTTEVSNPAPVFRKRLGRAPDVFDACDGAISKWTIAELARQEAYPPGCVVRVGRCVLFNVEQTVAAIKTGELKPLRKRATE